MVWNSFHACLLRKGLKIVNANWIIWWKRGKIFLYSEVIQHFWRNWMIVTDLIGLRSVEFLKCFLVYFDWKWSNRFSSFNSKICETFTITCSWNFKVFFKNKLQKYSDNVILENSFRFAGKIKLDLLFWPFYFHLCRKNTFLDDDDNFDLKQLISKFFSCEKLFSYNFQCRK